MVLGSVAGHAPRMRPVVLPLITGEARLRFQGVPGPDARALPTAYGLDEERSWLRAGFSREYDAAAHSVMRALARHPSYSAAPETMADAVAVRLYLSAFGVGLSDALRGGLPGPHTAFGRCVAAGLDRLPTFRGATASRAVLDGWDVREISERRIVRDWGFVEALTEPAAQLPGTVDVLVWSMTARHTGLLEPDDEHRADGRVLFLPGTSFKVLDAVEPGPGRRGRILLRELSPDEAGRGHAAFDNLTLSSLRRAAQQWAGATTRARIGSAALRRFGDVPGLA